jgi:hypothetical protein
MWYNGVILVERSGTSNPTTEAPTVKAAAVEEEAKIEEIVHPEEENEVARKRGDEWVFYEEDHSDRAVHKL